MDPDIYLRTGPDPLTDLDLLALALARTGGRGSRTIASDLLDRHGSLGVLLRASPLQLRDVPGLGTICAARLHASLQLGARASRERPPSTAPVRSPEAALAWLRPLVAGESQEVLAALYLNRQLRPVACRVLTRGTTEFTVVDPRQIMRLALEVDAHALILGHNHPSGDCEPSAADRLATGAVFRAAQTVGLKLLDHMILFEDQWVSMSERGALSGA